MMITIIWSTNHMEIKLCFSVITNIIYLIWLTVHWSLIWSYFRQWSLIWSYFRQWSPGSPAAESPNGIPCPAQPEIWIEKYFNIGTLWHYSMSSEYCALYYIDKLFVIISSIMMIIFIIIIIVKGWSWSFVFYRIILLAWW